jgi:threonine/homoserine/homoserine lactone efflux protein
MTVLGTTVLGTVVGILASATAIAALAGAAWLLSVGTRLLRRVAEDERELAHAELLEAFRQARVMSRRARGSRPGEFRRPTA